MPEKRSSRLRAKATAVAPALRSTKKAKSSLRAQPLEDTRTSALLRRRHRLQRLELGWSSSSAHSTGIAVRAVAQPDRCCGRSAAGNDVRAKGPSLADEGEEAAGSLSSFSALGPVPRVHGPDDGQVEHPSTGGVYGPPARGRRHHGGSGLGARRSPGGSLPAGSRLRTARRRIEWIRRSLAPSFTGYGTRPSPGTRMYLACRPLLRRLFQIVERSALGRSDGFEHQRHVAGAPSPRPYVARLHAVRGDVHLLLPATRHVAVVDELAGGERPARTWRDRSPRPAGSVTACIRLPMAGR